MKEFLFVFRNDYTAVPDATPEQMQEMTQRWIAWMTDIQNQDKLVARGQRLLNTGKVLKPGTIVTNGPYTDIKETIGGYSIVQAESYDDAIELAKGCPIFSIGGSVEVREVNQMM